MNAHWRFALPMIWALCIAVICLMPQKDIPHPRWFSFPNADKAVHAVLYFVLAALMYRALIKITKPGVRLLVWVVSICMTYGLMIEFAQSTLTTDRAFEWLDVCFNILGTLVSVMVCYFLLPPKIFFTRYKI